MSWLDIVILIIIVIPTFIGLKKGIIKAVLTLVGAILGVILAGQYYGALAGALGFISNESVANVVAFAIILIAVMVAASIVAAIIKWAVSAVMLGWVNRLGGAVLGFVMGTVFCGALLSMWASFLGVGETMQNSFMAQFLLNIFPLVLALLPEEFDAVRSFFQ